MTDRLEEIKKFVDEHGTEFLSRERFDWLIQEVERLRVEVADLKQPGCARPWPANKETSP